MSNFFFFQAEDGIRDRLVTGVQTCALPISQMILKEKITFNIEALKLNRNPNFEKYVI